MTGLLRAGGLAAAVTFLASLFAAPAHAADAVPAQTSALLSVPAIAVPAISQFQAEPVPAVIEQAPAPAPAAIAPARPLRDLVISFVDYGNQDAEQECLAKAIYFEARGETLEGQLAVAEVILNRAASGIYPATICGVVTQPAQFSFIRGGRFPAPNRDSSHWRTALAISDIALKGQADLIGADVLWYHANYVAPSWGRRLTRVTRIGTHIFYS